MGGLVGAIVDPLLHARKMQHGVTLLATPYLYGWDGWCGGKESSE